jgi:hypothetical protein
MPGFDVENSKKFSAIISTLLEFHLCLLEELTEINIDLTRSLRAPGPGRGSRAGGESSNSPTRPGGEGGWWWCHLWTAPSPQG